MKNRIIIILLSFIFASILSNAQQVTFISLIISFLPEEMKNFI